VTTLAIVLAGVPVRDRFRGACERHRELALGELGTNIGSVARLLEQVV
jgi:hypothetical protein